MEIFSLALLVLYLVSTLPVHVVAENAVDASTASTLIKEGQSAEILCMTKGTGDYFWRKGESLLNSSLVASFTGGQVSKDAEPYVVTKNGTLIIKIVTLGDEGKYFCRVSSVINECYGELNVFVEASLRSFVLAIDRCDRKSSCLLFISPTQSTSLTCTATNASPSMTLKWFNGSKEITEGIEKYDLPTQNGNAREIRSTITAVYGHPASLTCQAVDPKRGNSDVRFAHAQVETTVPVTATLPSWIIVAITLAGCLIVFGIYVLIKAMANRTQKKKYKKLKTQAHQSLQVVADSKDKELSELKVLAESKDSELSELKKRIANNEGKLTVYEEIAKIKDQEMKNKEEELTKLKSRVPYHLQEISSLKGDVRSKAKAIAELEGTLKQKRGEVENKKLENIELQKTVEQKDIEISTQQQQSLICQDKLRQQEEEIKKERDANVELQNTIANANGKITVAVELAQRGDKEITKLNEKVEQKDKEIKDQRDQFIECQTNLQRKETDIKRKDDKMFELEGNLTAKDNELAKIKKELDKLKGNLTAKDNELAKIKKELDKLEEELTQKDHKLQDLYKESRNAERGSHRRQGKNEKGN